MTWFKGNLKPIRNITLNFERVAPEDNITLPTKPKPGGSELVGVNRKDLRWVVAVTPVPGAVAFPVLVPLTMAKVRIGAGVGLALLLSGLWFVGMLKTSEIHH